MMASPLTTLDATTAAFTPQQTGRSPGFRGHGTTLPAGGGPSTAAQLLNNRVYLEFDPEHGVGDGGMGGGGGPGATWSGVGGSMGLDAVGFGNDPWGNTPSLSQVGLYNYTFLN